MPYIQNFRVYPSVPKELVFLEKLSRNLWWSWNRDAKALFRRIDPSLWKKSRHNPILFSTLLTPERLDNLAGDTSFLAHMERVMNEFNRQIFETPDETDSPFDEGDLVAYFPVAGKTHQ